MAELAKLDCPGSCREYTLPRDDDLSKAKKVDPWKHADQSSIGSNSQLPPRPLRNRDQNQLFVERWISILGYDLHRIKHFFLSTCLILQNEEVCVTREVPRRVSAETERQTPRRVRLSASDRTPERYVTEMSQEKQENRDASGARAVQPAAKTRPKQTSLPMSSSLRDTIQHA